MSKAEGDFVEHIIYILQTMGPVVAEENRTAIELYKDNILFGKIKNKKIFLINRSGKFSEVNKELVTQALNERRKHIYRDKLLIRVTKAYWLALEQTKSHKHLQSVLKTEI